MYTYQSWNWLSDFFALFSTKDKTCELGIKPDARRQTNKYNFLFVILCCQYIRKRRTVLNKGLFSWNAYNYEHVTRLISWPNSTNQFPLSGEQCRSGNGSFSTVNVIFSSFSFSFFSFKDRSRESVGRKREAVSSMWNIEALPFARCLALETNEIATALRFVSSFSY